MNAYLRGFRCSAKHCKAPLALVPFRDCAIVGLIVWLIGATGPAFASTPLQVDDPWNAYSFGFVSGAEVNALAPVGPFTFTTAVPVSLQVTDTHQTGEEFSIFLGSDTSGPLLLDTPAVAFNVGPGLSQSDPEVTFADSRWSSGGIVLPPGSYTITVRQNASLPGYTFWNLAIRLVSEPSANFVVTKVFDTNDGSCDLLDCSLREAVIAANLHPGTDEILIPRPDVVLDLAGAGEDAAATGDLDVLDDVIIRGDVEPYTMVLQRSEDRVFDVFPGVSMELRGVKIVGGEETTTAGGGAIRNRGTLEVSDCVLAGNKTTGGGSGGAIVNDGGSLIVRRSRLLGNIANGHGGAIANTNGADALIEDTAIEANSTREPTMLVVGLSGGGIYTKNSPLIVRRSLFLRNHASADGGALMSDGDTTALSNCTFVENSATSDGGAIRSARGVVTINSSTFVGSVDTDGGHLQNGPSDVVTVSNSLFSAGHPMNCFVSGGGVVSAGFNLDDDGSCGFAQGSDLVAPAGVAGLAFKGGATEVIALCTAMGSPVAHCTGPSAAVDGANPTTPGGGGAACPADDQTGNARPNGAACDIGAYEAAPSDCDGDLNQCFSDLGDCTADLGQCQTAAAQTQATLTQCEADLSTCATDAAVCQDQLDATEATLSMCTANLSVCDDDLLTTQATLAAATADSDQDSESDINDSCPGTPAVTAVDQVGCSLAQFCSAFDVSTGQGRRACKRADWMNDEPAMRRRDRDCDVVNGACSPAS